MSNSNTTTTLTIAAIVAAIGLVGVLAIETLILPQQQQQAYAAGCKSSLAFNASKGRCFGHGP
jgi:hypothetical protein